MTKAKDYLILAFFTLILLSPGTKSLQCGKEEIENCIKCAEKKNINRCEICEDKYFLSEQKLFCIPCTDEKQGQPGCEGSCEAINYAETRVVYCDNCKDGYVNMERICVKCEIQQPHCSNVNMTMRKNWINSDALNALKDTNFMMDIVLITFSFYQVVRNAILKEINLYVMNVILIII